MDQNETSIKSIKKVFTTAHKSKTSLNNQAENSEVNKKDAAAKIKKPKELKVPKDPKEVSGNTTVDSVDKTAGKPVEKKLRRRKSKKKNETDEICKEIEEINLKKSLSAEAAPFVPGEHGLSTNRVTSPSVDNSKVKTSNINVKSSTRNPVSRPKPKDQDLRKVEINQLQIRFSPTGFTMTKNSSEDFVTMQCVLPITDPEFSYDLETVRIEIILPKGYPGTKDAPIRPQFNILNSDIPNTIKARIERNLKWGLNSLEGGILVCRPILRYLEDNLEKWMVDDVRESAFKFVKPSEIKVTEKPETSGSEESETDYSNENFTVEIKTSASGTTSSSVSSRISIGDWLAPPPITDQSAVGGTPFTLKLYFSTIRGIDLFTSQRLTFLAACDRCKFNFPVEDLRPFVDRIEHCPKCTNQAKFCYKAQLVTPGANYEDEDNEYEAILGSVRFLRARPVDLLPSLYQCACSRCYGSEEDQSNSRSSCKIEKVKVGENINYGCFNCHQKIRFQIDRIEWISEQVAGSAGSSQKQQNKLAVKNGPVLSVGTPLPQNGACEHYKKSFRWYRFPCCGQAFPCDECHAKDPVAKNHPVEWATRFICGFCSREQSINIKECPECGKDTSASGRKFTSFWEGGKGTRNQALMNRKDSKKYKNYSTNSSSAIKTKPKPKKETA